MPLSKIRTILISFLALVSVSTYAHKPNLASFILSKTDDGKYIIQLTGALTGFESQINYHFGKNAYKTPEEFRELVINRFTNTTSLFIDGKQIGFKNTIVVLGHETKLLTEAIGIPKNANQIKLTNTFFENTSRNQLITMFILDSYPKQKYVLNNKNKQTINIVFENNKWIKNQAESDNFIYYMLLIVGLIALSIGIYFKKKYNN